MVSRQIQINELLESLWITTFYLTLAISNVLWQQNIPFLHSHKVSTCVSVENGNYSIIIIIQTVFFSDSKLWVPKFIISICRLIIFFFLFIILCCSIIWNWKRKHCLSWTESKIYLIQLTVTWTAGTTHRKFDPNQGSNPWPPTDEQYISCPWETIILTTWPS